ncbi:hypothetical protein [Frankia sp. AgKG'84/4]|uniref:hypothetical protein n=1 Tax=Frankia sp. AgKG'84/4 TaxID=573490 RepID=UPI00200BB0FB|nr:hypothetical protein [Frankia sp. AgKG'84/4]MCL9795458.1 hypothetical protein [Frankia sp. AgKG'84/4]
MHYVDPVTKVGPECSLIGLDLPHQERRPGAGNPGRPDRTGTRVRAALTRADQPLRARALARALNLPAAEVTAALRRLQDLGAAMSHDRRWTAVSEG